MANIKNRLSLDGFYEIIKEKPFLGICMGLQVLMTSSVENKGVKCLNLFEGEVLSLERMIKQKGEKFKIRHMGWNRVHKKNLL